MGVVLMGRIIGGIGAVVNIVPPNLVGSVRHLARLLRPFACNPSTRLAVQPQMFFAKKFLATLRTYRHDPGSTVQETEG
jgi:hypothetical protein